MEPDEEELTPTNTPLLLEQARSNLGHASMRACYTLSRSAAPRGLRTMVVLGLLEIVADKSLPGPQRGLAAEAVGEQLEFASAGKLRSLAIARLIEALEDTEPEVRFWAAFSLGTLRAVRARARLVALGEDRSVVPGWWSVGKEAEDAVREIDGRSG